MIFSCVKPKDLREMYRKAKKQGAEVAFTRNGHVRVSTRGGTVIGPSTSSDYRGTLNTRAALRRLGLNL